MIWLVLIVPLVGASLFVRFYRGRLDTRSGPWIVRGDAP
jgi:hypothetical protein